MGEEISSINSSNISLVKPAFLIVGLGNPGRQYQNNRHNIGFMLLDTLADRLGISFTHLQSKALIAKAEYHDDRLILAKPQTFMNLSGQAIKALVRFYKIPLERLLVAYDDIDLPLGSIRLRPNGGSGGHLGVESVIEHLKSRDFSRLRIGVNRPPGRMEASDYVLQDFSVAEKEALTEILSRSCEAALIFIKDGLEIAMQQYNHTWVKEADRD